MEERPGLGKKWTVIAIGALFVVALAAVWFVRQTYIYYSDIKQGKGIKPGAITRKAQVHPAVAMEMDKVKKSVSGTENDPFLGPASATHEIVEYFDFDCPYSRTAESDVRVFADKNPDVKIVFRDYPITDTHPDAWNAAKAARCVWRQGDRRKYWLYRETLFANQGKLDDANLVMHAEILGLDVRKLQLCMADRNVDAEIQRAIDSAEQAGTSGTPTFFVDGVMIEGVLPFETLD